jgi:DNA-binding NtrC family response regulator
MPRSILVVDDDEVIAELIKLLLNDAGYAVHAFVNAEKALGRLGAIEPSLIICDLWMSGMSGADFWRAVQAELTPPADPIPFLLVTGVPTARRGDTSMFAGVIDKPFDVEVLIEAVSGILDRDPLDHEIQQRAL